MKTNKIFIFLPLLLILLLVIASPFVAHADTTLQALVVKAILPKNQKVGVNGYYDLLVNSGDKQTIYMQITNNKTENITVNLVPANVYTRPEGGAFYDTATNSQSTILLDQSFALSSHILVENEVIIKGNQTVNVPIEVTVPNMQIGSILGGIMISEKEPTPEDVTESTKSNEAKFKVLTRTVYSVAIQLDFPKESTSSFSFGKAGFFADGAKVYIEMQNNAPMIQKDISGTYKVTNESGEKLFEGKIPTIIMAPKTQIDYSIPWNHTTLESGNYILSISANVAGKKINIEKKFIIDENAVAKYSEKANQPIARPQVKSEYLLHSIIAIVVIICIAFIFWFTKRKKYHSGLSPEKRPKPKHFKI